MNSLTVVELKKLAKSKGIKGYSTLRKSELLSALNRSPSRSKSPKVRKSRSRSKSPKVRKSRSRSKSRKVRKSPKSRSANRRSGKKDYIISIKPYFVKSDEDTYVPSSANIGKFIQKHALEAIKENIRDIDVRFNRYTGRLGVKFLSYNPKTRTLFFKVPGKFLRKKVKDFVHNLRNDSPLEGPYLKRPGRTLVLPEGGFIDYRDAIKLM
jgi:hypothetical protein